MGSCVIWGAPMSRSRSAGIASNSVRSRRCWRPSAGGAGGGHHPRPPRLPRNGAASDNRLVGYAVLNPEMVLVREPQREAQLVEQWQHVYEDLYSGANFTPAGMPRWARTSGAGTAVIPERLSRWTRCGNGRRPPSTESLLCGPRGSWRSVWAPGCCWRRSLPRVPNIGARTYRRRRSRRCRRRWHRSRGAIGCGCGCSRLMWQMGCRTGISTWWCSTR